MQPKCRIVRQCWLYPSLISFENQKRRNTDLLQHSVLRPVMKSYIMARSRTIQTASLAVWASCKRALYLEDPSLICPLLFIRSQEVLSRNCTHRELRDHGVKSASNCRASGSLEPSAGLNSGCLCHAAVANGAAGDAFFGDEDSNSTRKKRVEGAPNDLVPNLPRDSIT